MMSFLRNKLLLNKPPFRRFLSQKIKIVKHPGITCKIPKTRMSYQNVFLMHIDL